jgi:hypothetical protein
MDNLIMHTGTGDHRANITHELELQLEALVLVFAQDAVKLAAWYQYRDGVRGVVDVNTILKCLKARAKVGILAGGGTLQSRVEGMASRLDGAADADEDMAALAERLMATDEMTGSTAEDDAARHATVVMLVDRLCVEYDSWQPTNVLDQVFKMGIDRTLSQPTH